MANKTSGYIALEKDAWDIGGQGSYTSNLFLAGEDIEYFGCQVYTTNGAYDSNQLVCKSDLYKAAPVGTTNYYLTMYATRSYYNSGWTTSDYIYDCYSLCSLLDANNPDAQIVVLSYSLNSATLVKTGIQPKIKVNNGTEYSMTSSSAVGNGYQHSLTKANNTSSSVITFNCHITLPISNKTLDVVVKLRIACYLYTSLNTTLTTIATNNSNSGSYLAYGTHIAMINKPKIKNYYGTLVEKYMVCTNAYLIVNGSTYSLGAKASTGVTEGESNGITYLDISSSTVSKNILNYTGLFEAWLLCSVNGNLGDFSRLSNGTASYTGSKYIGYKLSATWRYNSGSSTLSNINYVSVTASDYNTTV